MSEPQVLLALIALFSTVVASVFGAMTWTQKTLVSVLKENVKTCQEEKTALMADNRANAMTVAKLGASVDKLTDTQAQGSRLLEDVLYDRPPRARGRSGD